MEYKFIERHNYHTLKKILKPGLPQLILIYSWEENQLTQIRTTYFILLLLYFKFIMDLTYERDFNLVANAVHQFFSIILNTSETDFSNMYNLCNFKLSYKFHEDPYKSC